jgi:hypothetical protein
MNCPLLIVVLRPRIVEHNIQEEEGKIFKSAEKTLDTDMVQNIMKQFEQEKQKIKMKSAA